MHRTFRRTLAGTLLGSLAFSAAVAAQPVDRFTLMDTAEHAAAARALFVRTDSNRDGRLSTAELDAARAALGLATPGPAAATPAEPTGAQVLFDRLDANHDGVVSTAEMQAAHSSWHGPAPAAPAAPASVAARASVTAAEHAARAHAVFVQKDSNHDGFLTRAEFDAGRPASDPR